MKQKPIATPNLDKLKETGAAYELRILEAIAGKLLIQNRAGDLLSFILDDLGKYPVDAEHLANLNAFTHNYIKQ